MAKDNSSLKRHNIGVLVDWMENQYQVNLILGIEAYCIANDINLICFEGGSLASPHEYEAQKNIIYQLVSKENVDGIIIVSPTIGHYASKEIIIEFCRQFHPLPIVNISLSIEGIPSVHVDNYTGIKELVTHLVEIHNYKRFAFIRGPVGNQDADQRYRILKDVLLSYNLIMDESMVIEGNFTNESGANAAKYLLNNKRGQFDIIIASSDDMAIGAINELNEKGIKIPDEIAITGFDNLDISMFSTPPLTTVNQPITGQGEKAAELLLKLIKGMEVPLLTVLPTDLMIRDSCGCYSRLTLDATTGSFSREEPLFDFIFNRKKDILIYEIMRGLDRGVIQQISPNIKIILDELLTTFYISLTTSEEKAFLKSWNRLLCTIIQDHSSVHSWHHILNQMRRQILPYLSDRAEIIKAEDLWHQVRIVISEKGILENRFNDYSINEETKVLNYLREELQATLNVKQFMNCLSKWLPLLGVKCFYLSIFDDGRERPGPLSKLIMAFHEDNQHMIHNQDIVFETKKIIPGELSIKNRRYSYILYSMYITSEEMGFLIFEKTPGSPAIYGALRRIIISALRGSMLIKKVKKQALHLKIQQRRLKTILDDLQTTMAGFIETMSLTIEKRDPYTAGHQHRVADLAVAIAAEMNLPHAEIEGIKMAAIIHDLGKIYVPAEILNKPGRLKDAEMDLIRSHPQVAFDILKGIEFPWPIAQIIFQHHERLDGSGYPNGLKGKDISLDARILCVADVVEAMASYRPYRPALGIKKALMEIEQNRGISYDPEVVDVCLYLFNSKGYEFKA